MAEGAIRYCTTDDGVNIAYCVAGEGPVTIVAMPAFFESFALDDMMPVYQQFYRALGEGRRIVRYDHRGTGLSAKLPEGANRGVAGVTADLKAVVEAVGEPVVLFAPTIAGPTGLLVAQHHPALFTKLLLCGTFAASDDAIPRDMVEALNSLARANWPVAMQSIADLNGRRAYPEEAAQLGEWYARSTTPQEYAARGAASTSDPRDPNLSAVTHPTLVLHRIADPIINFAAGQRMAAEITGARLVPLPGDVHLFCLGDYRPALDAIDEFLADRTPPRAAAPAATAAPAAAPTSGAGTAVILFTDIADSTPLTERLGDAAFREASRALDAAIRTAIADAGGTAVDGKLLGDGVMGVFASAAQAITAARRCRDLGADSEFPLHIGLHAGDVIRESGNVYGGAVNIASRICGLSASGEILVSGTVRDLARTSAGVSFEDRGEQALKGVADPVRVFAVG